MKPLVSFCIPTYNGIQYLPELMQSLLPQLDTQAEIIISDDCSSDGTYEYAKYLQGRYSQIRAYRNPSNLGMDGNFHQAVKYAEGKYIWFSGQDDRFGKGAYTKFLTIVQQYPEIDGIYFNYRQYFSEPKEHYGKTQLDISKDTFTRNVDEFFSYLDYAPSFLPAIIMRRTFWLGTDLHPFYGTVYVQVGCWLTHAKNSHVYIVADPTYIDCRCPLDSWKYTDGTMWYTTTLGTLAIYYIVLKNNPDAFPYRVYAKMYTKFLKELPFNSVFFKVKGMRIASRQWELTRTVFENHRLTYYFYVLPLLCLPSWLAHLLARLYNNKFGKIILCWLRKTILPWKR